MGQLLTQANVISKDASSSAPPRTDSEEVPEISDTPGKRPVKGAKEQSDDQDDIIRVCLDFQSGCEMDIDVKVKGDFVVSLL